MHDLYKVAFAQLICFMSSGFPTVYDINGIVQCRLDFFLVTPSLSYNVIKTDIQLGICSDHSLIGLSLKNTTQGNRG